MAADTFTNADGTLLTAHNTKWKTASGVDSGVIQSNAVQCGAAVVTSVHRFEDGQPQQHASEAFFEPGDWTDGIREVWCNGSDANDSYKIRVSSTWWSLYKDATILAGRFQIAHGLSVTGGLTMRVAQEAAGLIRVSLAAGDTTPTSIYTTTDGTPKTGGYPGFRVDKGANTRDQYRIGRWTDGVSTLTPYVRERLINKSGVAQVSQTGLTLSVWRNANGPTAAAPNPDQVIESVTTDTSGNTNVAIAAGSMVNGDKVWIVVHKPGTPDRATARRVTPVWA
jgi:hypothetical protein